MPRKLHTLQHLQTITGYASVNQAVTCEASEALPVLNTNGGHQKSTPKARSKRGGSNEGASRQEDCLLHTDSHLPDGLQWLLLITQSKKGYKAALWSFASADLKLENGGCWEASGRADAKLSLKNSCAVEIMVILTHSRCKLHVSPKNTAFTCFHSSNPCQHLSHLNFPHKRHLPKAGPQAHQSPEGWRKDRPPNQDLLQTSMARRYLRENRAMVLNWSGTESLEQWEKLGQRQWQPCFGTRNAMGSLLAALSGSFAHRAPQGAGEEGEAAARPGALRVPSGSTEGVKMAAGSSTCADVFPALRSQVRLGSVPAATPHVSSRTAPAGTYPAAAKPGGEVRGEAGTGREPSRRLRPAAVRRGVSRRAGPPHLWRAGGSGESSGLEMIRKYPVTWAFWNNRNSLFKLCFPKLFFFPLGGGKSLLPGRW